MRRDPIGRSPRRDCGLQKELGLFPRLPSKSREILEGLDQPPTLHAEKIAEETPEREHRSSICAVLEKNMGNICKDIKNTFWKQIVDLPDVITQNQI